MLIYRLLSSLVLIPLVLLALFWLPLTGFVLLLFILCLLATREWGKLAGFTLFWQRGALVLLVALLLSATLLLVPLTAAVSRHPLVQAILWGAMLWWLVALCLVGCYPRCAAAWSVSRAWRLLFGLSTLVPFFWGLLTLRLQGYHQENTHDGAWWVLYVLLLVWSADSGAYLFGKWLGKRPLRPEISPGKTWEGLCGGVLSALLVAGLLVYSVPLSNKPNSLLLCSLLTVLVSVLGDLTESMFKRVIGLKESGQLIPGHGGILDRIDSLTAAIPFFACLILFVFKLSH